MSLSAPNIAIAGVTGAVGQEFLDVLAERSFPIGNIKMLASARSAGKTVDFKGKTYTIEELTEDSFNDVDIALFSAGGSISKKFGPIAVEAGAVVVDNSSAFRMTEGVPLVVPEVNPEAINDAGIGLGGKTGSKPGIIANPNCSTIIMLMAVTPLHRQATVKRMVVSTYQAASGAGAAAMAELEQQSREVLDGKTGDELTTDIFGLQYAFNLFSHNSPMQPNGYNQEEMKMVHETHKIWQNDAINITATCIRVPVMRAHAESINLSFEQPIGEDEARELIAAFPGASLIDDRDNNRFPMPLDASGKDDVYVGRIRRDISQPADSDSNKAFGLDLFCCGDQIRKGAALNAVQIAELLV